ncbi:MAG: LDL receptor domain-containing protein [Candidatus Endonucleobacter sp. (ex Gigantidas childressi)]|nr:LDL receptor domain-containing protein [Candidatus Endonucleobacter sp. (ex Gigantidas childressi)]
MLNIIDYHYRLSLRLLYLSPLLYCNNRKYLKYINSYLCLLIALMLPATSLIYATNEDFQNVTANSPVTILLNKPNYLDECLTALRGKSVITLNNFLKTMIQLEADTDENNYTQESKVFFNQTQYAQFYNLYHVLSLRYYQGMSLTGFMSYMIYNKPTQTFNRPLMQAMLTLCYNYKDQFGITIGKMLDEVDKQEHTDENINAFLRYKANSVKDQCNALYIHPDNNTNKNNANSSGDSANKKSMPSLLHLCSQHAVNYAQRIARNASGFASKAICTVPFIGAMMHSVSAYVDTFACKNGQNIDSTFICNGYYSCNDGSDEAASVCCENGTLGIDALTRRCFKHDDRSISLFVCNNMQTTNEDWLCDGDFDCIDGSDESSGVMQPCFDCKDGTVIIRELVCNGQNNCPNGSDENPDCPAAFPTTALLVAGAITCATYAAMLVKYRSTKNTEGIRAWLLSPITKTVRYLRRARDCNKVRTGNKKEMYHVL